MPSQPFVTLAPAAARTANGSGEQFDLSQLANGRAAVLPPMLLVQAEVTAISGTATPTITFLVEHSIDGANWSAVGTFTGITTVSRQEIRVAISGVAQAAGFAWPFNPARVRVRWTVSGTNPSLTSNVKAVIL